MLDHEGCVHIDPRQRSTDEMRQRPRQCLWFPVACPFLHIPGPRSRLHTGVGHLGNSGLKANLAPL